MRSPSSLFVLLLALAGAACGGSGGFSTECTFATAAGGAPLGRAGCDVVAPATVAATRVRVRAR